MRTPAFLLLAPLALLAACNGDGTDTGGITGDDDDDVVPPDTDPPVDPCEVPGNVCTFLGVAPALDDGVLELFAGLSADGLPRTNPPHLWLETTLLFLPVDITFAPDGTAFYPDYNNHRIRRIGTDGVVTTMSGTGLIGDGPNENGSASNCYGGCPSLDSAWNHPTHVAIDPGNPDLLWVSAWHNSRVQSVDTATDTMTWEVGTGGRAFGEADTDGDGDFLDNAVLDLPSSVAFDSAGLMYVSDQANHVIRRVDVAAGTIEVIAGEPRMQGYDGDGGPAHLAHLHGFTNQSADPGSKIVIHDDVLYLADTANGVIRTIDLADMTIDTFAGEYTSKGTGTVKDGATGLDHEADLGSVEGYSGDGGPALEAVMNTPRDIAIGIDGELYIADTGNNCVRVVRDGIIDTFAGVCGAPVEFSGEGVPALDATFGPVFAVETDPDGNVYIVDHIHHVIRRVKR